jgi:hypothetical protein
MLAILRMYVDGGTDGWLGDGVEFGRKPGLEASQGFNTLGEQTVVLAPIPGRRVNPNCNCRAG